MELILISVILSITMLQYVHHYLHLVCMARGFDYARLAKEILKRDGKSISMPTMAIPSGACRLQYHYTTEIADLHVHA